MSKLLALIGGKPMTLEITGNGAWGYEVTVSVTDEGTWIASDKTVDLACEDIARRIQVARAMDKGQTTIW